MLWEIDNIGGFFLSRIKSKTVIYITEIVQGKISQKYIGTKLLSVPIKNKRSDILEVIVEKLCDKGTLCCRAIGFWNPVDKCYHWYITNLSVAAHLIYPLYRLRWQIELIFKACKQSLNANRLTSNNKHIIENLLLASIAAQLASHTVLDIVLPQLTKMKQLAVSVQRTAKITVLLAADFFNFLAYGSQNTRKLCSTKLCCLLMNFLTLIIDIDIPL
ncbi:transposase, IS4 [Beggiatoa sp. PS]|nr:transposase, IS4 [Beggiatoa sp. PS]